MGTAPSLQVLHALAALRIPDALQDSPKTAKELAPMVGECLPALVGLCRLSSRRSSTLMFWCMGDQKTPADALVAENLYCWS